MPMRSLLLLALLTPIVGAQHEHAAAAPKKPAQLLPGVGGVEHPIRTSSPEAQRFFNQGIALIYGFNHEEAARSFERAAELDPASPMPHWGVALALGPNINRDVDPEREKAAFKEAQKALALAAQAPPAERDYAQALARRYSDDPKADLKKLAEDYASAMRELSRRYPDDLDAAVLFAESMMDLRPWQLWTPDGKPAEGTEEIVATLERVLRRDPSHIGANHYYIHAVEASKRPERALASADRLGKLAPGAGHLVHMPGHIYLQLGDYDAVAKTNQAAADADVRYMKATGNTTGIYPVMYYSHNLQFLMAARAQQGQYAEALRFARQVASTVGPMAKEMSMLEADLAGPLFVMLRFHRWDEILAQPAPPPGQRLLNALWHFARANSFAGKGQPDQAGAERELYLKDMAQVPPDLPWGVNPVGRVAKVPEFESAARLAEARGDRDAAIQFWRQGIDAQDVAGYDEPPVWYYPLRESLGGSLLRAGRDAEAESVFREDLDRNPRNPRSLFGLMTALERQQKSGAKRVRKEFDQAWKDSKIKLRIEDL